MPFTHHTLIRRAIDTPLEARYCYIRRTAEEHLTTDMPEELRKTMPDIEELKKLL